MDLHDGYEGSIKIVRLRFLSVKDIHRVCAPRNGEDGCLVEVRGKLDGVQCGRGDNKLQVFPLLYCLLKHTTTIKIMLRNFNAHTPIHMGLMPHTTIHMGLMPIL